MKKLVLSTVLSVIVQISALSQGCLPDGIHFKTQEEIDNFSINYPNCTEIEGMVVIDDTIEGNITNLLGLSSLTKTGGNILRIANNSMLANLNGLENLDSIEFSFDISYNNSLTSISALESLVSVANIFIVENPSLINLVGLNKLDTITRISIIENDSLQDLLALSNLKKTNILLHIENNQSLQNLSGLENLVFVGEDLKILDNDLLTDLQGLNNLEHIIGFLDVGYNDQLTSLDGLENIDTIESGISIYDNIVLSSLASISDSYINFALNIHDNPLLELCNITSICEFLSGNPNYVEIYNNAPGCNSTEEVLETCDTIGVDNNNAKAGIVLYPNPAQDVLHIETASGSHVQLFSITGLLISESEIKTDHFELKLKDVSEGMYFLQFEKDLEIQAKKIIVQH